MRSIRFSASLESLLTVDGFKCQELYWLIQGKSPHRAKGPKITAISKTVIFGPFALGGDDVAGGSSQPDNT